MEAISQLRRYRDHDNYNWIRDAEKNQLVVGTQAHILYQDCMGRVSIALRNSATHSPGKDQDGHDRT